MTDLLLCAFLLAVPLVCLLVMHWIERALWARKTDRMLRAGMRMLQSDGRL